MFSPATQEAGIARAFRTVALIGVFALSVFAPETAQAQSQTKGDASLRLEYQFVRTGTFVFDIGEADYWTTDTQVLLLSADYAFSDRLTVFAALPYIRKRFNAGELFNGDPHNPNDFYWVDFVPPDKRFWDDGEYHGNLQDFSAGVSYLLKDGPVTVSPFISFGVPASNYPFFAKAAIGKNLWTIPVGVSLSYVPYFSDWYFSGSFAYVFSEKPLNVNVDYSLLHLSAGYWFTPRLSMNAFVSGKYTWQGYEFLDFVDDISTVVYPDDFGTEEWWNHDRLFAQRHLNIGAGFDYFLKEDLKVSGSGFKSTWAESTTETDFAFTVAVTRYFGGE